MNTEIENVFDDTGATVAQLAAEPDVEEAVEAVETPAAEAPEPAAAKYRIGDKEFATEKEALDYAQSYTTTLEVEKQVADAYQLGIQAALQHSTPATSVTPPPPQDDWSDEEYYANPKEFTAKREARLKAQFNAELEQRLAAKDYGDQAWRHFSERHPELTAFKTEVEAYAGQNMQVLQAITQTKGMAAAHDYIATNLKSQFNRYAEAVKPRRELPNRSGNVRPSAGGAPGVTPTAGSGKPLSMAQQIRSIKGARR